MKNLEDLKKTYAVPSRINLGADGFGNMIIKDYVIGNPFCFCDMIAETIDQARDRGCRQIYYIGRGSCDDLRAFALVGFEGEILPPEDKDVWVLWINL